MLRIRFWGKLVWPNTGGGQRVESPSESMLCVDCVKKETAYCPVSPDNYRDIVRFEDGLPTASVSFWQVIADHGKGHLLES